MATRARASASGGDCPRRPPATDRRSSGCSDDAPIDRAGARLDMAVMDPIDKAGLTVASPRWLNVLLGVWLFISAFLWPHSQAQFTNTWLMGVLAVIFALLASRLNEARYLNTL